MYALLPCGCSVHYLIRQIWTEAKFIDKCALTVGAHYMSPDRSKWLQVCRTISSTDVLCSTFVVKAINALMAASPCSSTRLPQDYRRYFILRTLPPFFASHCLQRCNRTPEERRAHSPIQIGKKNQILCHSIESCGHLPWLRFLCEPMVHRRDVWFADLLSC